MGRILDPENRFFQAVSWLSDLLGLSLLWIFLSLPLFTCGAASAALYDSVTACVLPRKSGAFARFFRVFRQSFQASVLPSLIWAALAFAAWAGGRVLFFMSAAGEAAATVELVIFCILLIIPAGVLLWQFPLFSRGVTALKELTGESFRLAMLYLLRTLIVIAGAGLAVWAVWYWWIPALITPVLFTSVQSWLMEPVFRKERPDSPAYRKH